MSNQMKLWLNGLLHALLFGVIGAILSAGITTVEGEINFKLMGVTTVSGALIGMFGFLKKQPLVLTGPNAFLWAAIFGALGAVVGMISTIITGDTINVQLLTVTAFNGVLTGVYGLNQPNSDKQKANLVAGNPINTSGVPSSTENPPA